MLVSFDFLADSDMGCFINEQLAKGSGEPVTGFVKGRISSTSYPKIWRSTLPLLVKSRLVVTRVLL